MARYTALFAIAHHAVRCQIVQFGAIANTTYLYLPLLKGWNLTKDDSLDYIDKGDFLVFKGV